MLNGQEEFEQRMSHLHLLKNMLKKLKFILSDPLEMASQTSILSHSSGCPHNVRVQANIRTPRLFCSFIPAQKLEKILEITVLLWGLRFTERKLSPGSELSKNSWNFQAGLEVYFGPTIVTLSSYQMD